LPTRTHHGSHRSAQHGAGKTLTSIASAFFDIRFNRTCVIVRPCEQIDNSTAWSAACVDLGLEEFFEIATPVSEEDACKLAECMLIVDEARYPLQQDHHRHHHNSRRRVQSAHASHDWNTAQ
jgi:hypothetical protein